MAKNNLRIVTANQITAVNSDTDAKSLNDYKSQGDTGNTFVLTTNSLSASPIAVIAYLPETTDSVGMSITNQTQVFETTTSAYKNQTTGYGSGKYIVKYYTPTAGTTSITVSFNATVKVSKFIVGYYWVPKYNTQYGIQVGFEDLSTTERLQSGDMYTTLAPRNKTLQFDLSYLDETDKFQLFDIYKSVGKVNGIFVSAFPLDSDQQKEQMFSIYGKFNTLNNITHTMFTMYSNTLNISEF
jgi:hypothetical protein